MYTLSNKKFLVLIFISALFAFTACDNPTSSDDDHDDHSDPFGVAMIMNGVEIAAQEDGVVTYNDGDHLELNVGEETNRITIRWIAEDGDRFQPETEEGFSLRWIVEHEDVLEVEQHEEDGAWSFHLVGVGAGESTINFELFHNDHADFTSLPFEVHVEQAVSGMEVRDGTGTVISIDENGTITGSVELSANETTEELTAVFFDDEGSEIELTNEYKLEWHVENGSEFVTIDGSTGNPFAFTLTGVAQGQATMHFVLIKEHGDHDDHDDIVAAQDEDDDDHDHDHEGEIEMYESPDITIDVN